ncbi:MAG: C4-dicarboxylate transporter [Moraxellaceae bacterium]|jgi:TRAP-type C4-dicarboxylate transport system substrate-binding protein|nr:C4-dicarboxylate transporter [Moraxellaceae bacterium]
MTRKFLGVLAASFLASALAVPVHAATLKIATLSPDGSLWMTKMRAGAADIKTRTEGRVEFKFYTGGTMGTDKAVLSKIRIGQLQGGAITGGSLADAARDIQVYSLPLKFRSFNEVDLVRGKMDPVLSKQLEDGGYVNFGFAEGGFAYAMSKNAPVTSVAGLRKQRVWIPDNDHQAELAMKVFQVTPVPLSLADVLPSLQTGIIDTVASSPIAAVALQWHTQVKYFTDLPLSYFVGTLAIDKKAFGRLAPADQAVVREVMSRVFREIDAQNRKDNVSAYGALLKQGIKPVKPTAAEVADWERNGELATAQMIKDGIVSAGAAQQLNTLLATARAGKK